MRTRGVRGRRSRRTESRTSCWSSTQMMLIVSMDLCGWDVDGEGGEVAGAAQVDGAVVAVDEAPDDGEAEAEAEVEAFFLGGEVGLEDFFLDVVGDGGAVVADGDADVVFRQEFEAVGVDEVGADVDGGLLGAGLGHGVVGVLQDVGPDLDEFADVGVDFRDGLQVGVDGEVFEFVGEEVHGVVDGLDDVDAGLPGGVAAAEEFDGAYDAGGVPGGDLHVVQVVPEFPEAVVLFDVPDHVGAEFAEAFVVRRDVGEDFGGDLRHVEFVFVFAGAFAQGGLVDVGVAVVAEAEDVGVFFAGFLEVGADVVCDEVGAPGDDADGVVEFVGDAGGELSEGDGHFVALDDADGFFFFGGAVEHAPVAFGEFVDEDGEELVFEGAVGVGVDGFGGVVDVGEFGVFQGDDVVGAVVGAREEGLDADVAAGAGAEDFVGAGAGFGGQVAAFKGFGSSHGDDAAFQDEEEAVAFFALGDDVFPGGGFVDVAGVAEVDAVEAFQCLVGAVGELCHGGGGVGLVWWLGLVGGVSGCGGVVCVRCGLVWAGGEGAGGWLVVCGRVPGGRPGGFPGAVCAVV